MIIPLVTQLSVDFRKFLHLSGIYLDSKIIVIMRLLERGLEVLISTSISFRLTNLKSLKIVLESIKNSSLVCSALHEQPCITSLPGCKLF